MNQQVERFRIWYHKAMECSGYFIVILAISRLIESAASASVQVAQTDAGGRHIFEMAWSVVLERFSSAWIDCYQLLGANWSNGVVQESSLWLLRKLCCSCVREFENVKIICQKTARL